MTISVKIAAFQCLVDWSAIGASAVAGGVASVRFQGLIPMYRWACVIEPRDGVVYYFLHYGE